MIAILVSSELAFVQRAVASVSVRVVLVINSRNDSFIEECITWATHQDIVWVLTESNGCPGKGHNACLDLLTTPVWLRADPRAADLVAQAEGLYLLDGDDAYYPTAFQLLTQVSADVIHLMVHDQFTADRRDMRHVKLHGHFYLYTSQGMHRNHWLHQDIKSPFSTALSQCRTPSRILYVSRKAAARLRYDETCRLYDDYLPILTMMDLQDKGELTTMAVAHPDIYCYHGCNEGSATTRFVNVWEEQERFRQSVAHLGHLDEGFADRLRRLPYTQLEGTWPMAEKMAFVHTHFVETEVAVTHRKAVSSPTPLFYWRLLEQYGVTSPLLYDQMATCLSRMGLETQAALARLKSPSSSSSSSSSSPFSPPSSVVLYAGMSPPFDGVHHEAPIYGSELAAVRLAEQWASLCPVTVCCNTSRVSQHQGVTYVPLAHFPQLTGDLLIVSRFVWALLSGLSRFPKVIVWLHDARAHEWSPQGALPHNGRILFRNAYDKVAAIVCVSQWHREWAATWAGTPLHKFHVIPNGLTLETRRKRPKIPGRFIFPSDPSRGLQHVLPMIPDLQGLFPTFHLHVFFHAVDETLRKQCASLPVTLHGKVTPEQLGDEWEQAEYFLYPLDGHETFCMNALDAQYHEVILVAPQSTGLTTSAPHALLLPGSPATPSWQQVALSHIAQLENDPIRKAQLIQRTSEWAAQQTWSSRLPLWTGL